MNRRQMKFLEHLAKEIPKLIEIVHQGNYSAEMLLGRRNIDGQVISLRLTAKLENPDEEKSIHGSAMPIRDVEPEE